MAAASQSAPELQRRTSALTEGSSGAEEGQAGGKGKGKAGRKFNPRNPGRTGKCLASFASTVSANITGSNKAVVAVKHKATSPQIHA